ncbi:class I SAM-dependent methyltransferase [Exilibacterium tricleocarpae]|uniref:Class I SAM-dependent methyltransferase n=1 Tax=Exilibacterium tricleocarpae TaxID=2591008 RepID=A0A545SLX3_9GAMM|nr:class I SAM-dependent methyltransferase [Exilibacterium tricleocarpae]TQV65980.1 class I SAM-dependent methyltransferase [Exilibacterium tricleocarpae]
MQTVDFSRLKMQPHQRLLDLGCGEGRHSLGAYMLHEAIDVYGVDLSHRDLTTAAQRFREFDEPDNPRKRLSLAVADGLRLPFADNSFDRVVCAEVLEHIPDYRGMLREIDRVLKPDGLLAISVPRAWPERVCWALSEAYHRVEGGHIRIFNAAGLRRDVENHGLRRYARHWAHALHVPFWWLKCLFWGRDNAFLVRQYHRFLVWDLMQKPRITRWLDRCLNPLMGKSVVMYFKRDVSL